MPGSAIGLMVALSAAAAPPEDVEADLDEPFSHDSHLVLTMFEGGEKRRYTCNDCHALKQDDASQEALICESPRMPFPSHDKCIRCHAPAFFEPPIVICTNCHTGITITEKSPLKEQTGPQAPLRTEFSHQLHLDPKMRVRKRFKREKDCSFCHRFVKDGAKVLLPDHAQCCQCHTKEDVKPRIEDCAGCHARPKRARNPRSIVKKFSHAQHKIDPATDQPLACVRCHFEVPRSTKIRTLVLPKMATCVECHQGILAFSYDECLKCHEKGIEARSPPLSHPASISSSDSDSD